MRSNERNSLLFDSSSSFQAQQLDSEARAVEFQLSNHPYIYELQSQSTSPRRPPQFFLARSERPCHLCIKAYRELEIFRPYRPGQDPRFVAACRRATMPSSIVAPHTYILEQSMYQ